MKQEHGRKEKIEKVSIASPDIRKERLEELKRVIPEAFTEGKIDAEKFFAALGEDIDDRPDRYSFSWAGKKDAIRILQTTSRGTLKPAKDESVNWDTTQNLFIEGDNLEVLKLLYKSYFGRVKMIYIDPPYNTGNDFIYPDNYADPLDTYLKITGQKDENGNLLTSNPETNGRYHSTWLSMMYPRLFLARQLLREDGVIFVSIDDHEVYNLRLLMNEIFGEENFVECFVWKKSYGGGSKEKYAVTQHENILFYARNFEQLDELWLPPDEEAEKKYYKYEDKKGKFRLKPLEATKSMDSRPNLIFPIPAPDGSEICPKRQWWWNKERVIKALHNDELVFTQSKGITSVSYKQYLFDENGEKRGRKPFSIIEGIYTQHGTEDLRNVFGGEVIVQFPKPVNLINVLLNIGCDADNSAIVLDFFSGSCTTAQALLELNREDGGNRRFIMVQLPEPTEREDFPTIADIGKERIRRVIKKLHEEANGQLDLKDRETPEDLGFKVFKLSSSNYQIWEGVNGETDPDAYKDLLKGYDDPLVMGWKTGEVLYEIALKEGYSLNAVIEKENIGSLTVYRIDDPERDQSFRVCLDDKLTLEVLKSLNLKKDDLFVCRSISLDDTIAANLALQCRLMVI